MKNAVPMKKPANKKPANNTAITLDDIALMHGNPDLLCINSNEQEPSNIAVDTTSQTRVLRLLDARMEHQGNDIYVPGTCYILTSSMASMLLGKDIESYGVGVVIASGIDPKKTPKIRGLEVGYELNGVYHGKNRLGILTPPLTIWAKEMEFTFESHEFALIGDGKGQARRYKDGIITLEDAVFYIQAPLPPLPVREKRLKRAIIGYTTGFLTGSAFATIGTGICTLVLIGYLGDNFPHTDDNIISQISSCLAYKTILGIDAAVIVAGGLLGALKTENRKPQVLQEDWFFLNGAFYGKVKDHRYTCITDILEPDLLPAPKTRLSGRY